MVPPSIKKIVVRQQYGYASVSYSLVHRHSWYALIRYHNSLNWKLITDKLPTDETNNPIVFATFYGKQTERKKQRILFYGYILRLFFDSSKLMTISASIIVIMMSYLHPAVSGKQILSLSRHETVISTDAA